MRKILIVGLGNPILGDDGIGWHIAESVERHLKGTKALDSFIESRPQIDVDYLAIGGLSLMEHLAGYNRALIIDAIITHQVPVGTVSVFNLKDLPDQAAGHLSSSHDTTLQKALQVGRTMGVDLPEQITIIAIEAETVFDFSEELTPAVAAVVPQATQTVLEILHQEEQIP